jgi:hypothetical protein
MTLKSYLVLLATDVGRLGDFLANPAAAAEDAGVSKEDRAILFSGDQGLIYTSLTRLDPK